MSSRLRRDPPELIDADADVGLMLAADADRVLKGGDWRAAIAGGSPTVIAEQATPKEWHARMVMSPILTRAIAKIAAEQGIHPNQWIQETIVNVVNARTGIPKADLFQGMRKTRPLRTSVLHDD
jgi:hypothetical protein